MYVTLMIKRVDLFTADLEPGDNWATTLYAPMSRQPPQSNAPFQRVGESMSNILFDSCRLKSKEKAQLGLRQCNALSI